MARRCWRGHQACGETLALVCEALDNTPRLSNPPLAGSEQNGHAQSIPSAYDRSAVTTNHSSGKMGLRSHRAASSESEVKAHARKAPCISRRHAAKCGCKWQRDMLAARLRRGAGVGVHRRLAAAVDYVPATSGWSIKISSDGNSSCGVAPKPRHPARRQKESVCGGGNVLRRFSAESENLVAYAG